MLDALASAGASLEGRAPAQVPLQEGPQVSTEPAGGACAVGVSSFAYQGSNAHALVAVTEAGSDSREESGAWRRRRCWFTAASPNRLVERALRAPRGGVALLQVQLGGRYTARKAPQANFLLRLHTGGGLEGPAEHLMTADLPNVRRLASELEGALREDGHLRYEH